MAAVGVLQSKRDLRLSYIVVSHLMSHDPLSFPSLLLCLSSLSSRLELAQWVAWQFLVYCSSLYNNISLYTVGQRGVVHGKGGACECNPGKRHTRRSITARVRV